MRWKVLSAKLKPEVYFSSSVDVRQYLIICKFQSAFSWKKLTWKEPWTQQLRETGLCGFLLQFSENSAGLLTPAIQHSLVLGCLIVFHLSQVLPVWELLELVDFWSCLLVLRYGPCCGLIIYVTVVKSWGFRARLTRCESLLWDPDLTAYWIQASVSASTKWAQAVCTL